jgi:hypothetical protein
MRGMVHFSADTWRTAKLDVGVVVGRARVDVRRVRRVRDRAAMVVYVDDYDISTVGEWCLMFQFSSK